MNLLQIVGNVDASRRAHAAPREAGLDGVEVAGGKRRAGHQFLSSAINDRDDEYGGLAREPGVFALEIVRAIRPRSRDFYVGFKISVDECMNEVLPWLSPRKHAHDSVQIWTGARRGGGRRDPLTRRKRRSPPAHPPSTMPVQDFVATYDTICERPVHVSQLRRLPDVALQPHLPLQWERPVLRARGGGDQSAKRGGQGGRLIRFCGGGLQTASVVADAITSGACDGVTIARSLCQPQPRRARAEGHDRRRDPCTYDEEVPRELLETARPLRREPFDSREQTLEELLSIYREPGVPR